MKRLVFIIALAAVFVIAAFAGANVVNRDASPFSAATNGGVEALAGSSATPETAAPDNGAATVPGAESVSSAAADPGASPSDSASLTTGGASPDASAGDGSGTSPDSGAAQSPDASSAPNPVSPPNTEEQVPSQTPDTASSPDSTGATPGTQPPLLTEMIEKAGLSFDAVGHSQLILVAAGKSSADIYCYDRGENGLWKLNESIGYIKGYAGRNGVNFDKREGDGCSPGGLFGLGYAFGNSPKPETGLPWRAITKDTYWIDDPNSKYYNQWVENVDDADWTGGEHLSTNVTSYAFAVVIEYNTAPNTIAGKGSAIFLHIGSKPTSGCVTVTKETLLKMLKWLSADKQPGILIVGK